MVKKINKKQEDWRILEFFAPIDQTACFEANNEGKKEFLIKGIAISEEVTRNDIRYIASELEASAPSFRNKPILLDHRNEVRSIVGKTTQNVNYNPRLKAIEFEARIMDKQIQAMINDGRIVSVSIGARVQNLEKGKDGIVIAKGIEGLKISLVAVPGSKSAGINFAHSLENSFRLKESLEMNDEGETEDSDEFVEEEKIENKVEDYNKWLVEQHMELAKNIVKGNKSIILGGI